MTRWAFGYAPSQAPSRRWRVAWAVAAAVLVAACGGQTDAGCTSPSCIDDFPNGVTAVVAPSAQTVAQGRDATFTVTTSKPLPSPSYQWYRRRVGGAATAIAGATSPSFTWTSAQPADDGLRFSAEVRSGSVVIVSDEARLNVF